jgi:hypothetical protein
MLHERNLCSRHKRVRSPLVHSVVSIAWTFQTFDQNKHPLFHITKFSIKKTPWSESASELHRPSDRRLSAK